MPYIKSNDGRRKALQNGDKAQTAGELNYQIFWYVKNYVITFEDNSSVADKKIRKYVEKFLGSTPNYQRYNDMAGCLTLCYKEIKRRLGFNSYYLIHLIDKYDKEIAEYENLKINQNGDVE